MRFIAPFGFYGAGNIGDEATLQGFAKLVAAFDPSMRGWIASRDPQHTRRVEPSFRYFRAQSIDVRRRWGWMTGDVMMVPGGTPIMDSLGAWPFSELLPLIARATHESMPIVFIGTGTERLVRDESIRVVADVLAPRVLRWTVRCSRDLARLVEYGVAPESVTATADMAWLLDPVTTDRGRNVLARIGVDPGNALVGVNVNFEDAVRARQPGLLQALAASLDALIAERNVRVLFLCNEIREDRTFDLAASREVISAMTHGDRTTIVPNEYWSPQVMMSLIACCETVVSTRYHFCLFAAVQGVPFLAMKRSDKVTDLCDDLQWGHAISLEEAHAERLTASLAELYAARGSSPAVLSSAVPAMRIRAGQNALALQALRQHVSG